MKNSPPKALAALVSKDTATTSDGEKLAAGRLYGDLEPTLVKAQWAILKTQLEYKSNARSAVFQVVNESDSTQACSCCGGLTPNSPKGRAGLRIRVGTCSECGTLHDRDVNASKNILAAGHCRLAVGIPILLGRGGCQVIQK
ncbi:transposase [Klebsiella sp. DNRA6]|uniref:transposase n=1 Tax=Klebsiella sp. DNRA6 TaxID=2723057 RepID=UPI002006E5D0